MKRFFLPVALGLITAVAAAGSDLVDVKTVYLLPMANGLDQYLAIRLTTGTSLQVVTDPQKADAVLTDRIGKSFEEKFNELYGAKPAKGEPEDPSRATMQPMSRGKGAIFLVDRKTRNVLWSTYALAKSTSPDDLNHLADRIVSHLGKDRRIK